MDNLQESIAALSAQIEAQSRAAQEQAMQQAQIQLKQFETQQQQALKQEAKIEALAEEISIIKARTERIEANTEDKWKHDSPEAKRYLYRGGNAPQAVLTALLGMVWIVDIILNNRRAYLSSRVIKISMSP